MPASSAPTVPIATMAMPAASTHAGPLAGAAWLVAALLFAALFIGRSMAPAFAGPHVVQDDARQHVFWMMRWHDPTLFQDDLFATYFAAQAPPGYALLYWLLARAVDPLAASKLVPPVLGLAAAGFTYLFVRRLHRSPSAAFLATVIGSWYVWQYDDLPSGSPRAFLLPLLAAQLWLLASGRRWPAAGVAALGALFYPTAGVLLTAILGATVVRLDTWPPRLARDRVARLAPVAAGCVVLLAVLPALLEERFGPTVSAASARAMPEFGPSGRNAFFFPDPYQFWIASYRGGLDLRVRDVTLAGMPILYELAALAALFPLLLLVARRARAVRSVRPQAVVLAHVLLASFGLFFFAHALLFRLYLPSRFVQWSLPLVLAVSAGLGLAILFEIVAALLKGRARGVTVALLALVCALALAVYPARYDGNFVTDRYPRISAYLRAQPPDTLVAAVPTEADSVPAFSGRRVLTAREYALAYHTGYYATVAQRTRDLIDVYYTDSPRRVTDVAEQYGVDLFLVNRSAYDRDRFADAWAGEFEPYVSEIRAILRRSGRFALLDAARRCGTLTEGDVTVVSVSCVQSTR